MTWLPTKSPIWYALYNHQINRQAIEQSIVGQGASMWPTIWQISTEGEFLLKYYRNQLVKVCVQTGLQIGTLQNMGWRARPLSWPNCNVVRTTPMHPITTTTLITNVELLHVETVTMKISTRTQRCWSDFVLNERVVFLISSYCNVYMAPSAAARSASDFHPSISNVYRRCTVFLFLFGKKPTHDTMPNHSTSAPRDPYQHTWGQPPSYWGTSAMVAIEHTSRTFTD